MPAYLERIEFFSATTPSEDLVTVLLATSRVERVSLEHGTVHVRSEDERVGVAVVSCIVAAGDVTEGALAGAELL